mmetsp:Transcript_78609/g.163383  ORF Transcript_78609/g.163383 Transcript_78609/m.163383 type:complete len:279 (+) Transcript_78609:177-1013(+)
MARIPPTLSLEDLDRILPTLVERGLPDGGEFLFADLNRDERTAQLIALLIWHGFLPMGGMKMLLPKIHLQRCILAPQDIHIGKKIRKKAKGYHLTVDAAWDLVVNQIQQLTYSSEPGDCWLSDDMAYAYAAVAQVPPKWLRGGATFHSVELWHTESGELVAGEIGYTCGCIYSSATGFSNKDKYSGCGTVQLAALGRWLLKLGFQIWDLGMDMDYKRDLGGNPVPRSDWIRILRSCRDRPVRLTSPPDEEQSASALLGLPAESPSPTGPTGPTAEVVI